jgi:hypothetical protein
MIISWISGGLGNQMFQYALGKVLSYKNADELFLDLSGYNPFITTKDTPRIFELDIFRLKYIEASRSTIVRLSDSSPVINSINNLFKTKMNPYPKGYVQEAGHGFQSSILELQGNRYLKGFWQTEKYFKDYTDLIRSEFRFAKPAHGKNKSLLEEMKTTNSVSVHVRRGDYVSVKTTNKFHGTCDLSYYLRATNYISKHIVNPTYYVFSDDPKWCKTNLKFSSKTVIISHNSGDKSWEDLRLMSNCKHNIIANSSFSWWGGWLNNNPHKIIVAPKVWFRDKSVDTKDVVPSTWIKL